MQYFDPGVCCQIVNKRHAAASYIFFASILVFGSTRARYIDICMCVYRHFDNDISLCNLIFLVTIGKVSDKLPKINKRLMQAPMNPPEAHRCSDPLRCPALWLRLYWLLVSKRKRWGDIARNGIQVSVLYPSRFAGHGENEIISFDSAESGSSSNRLSDAPRIDFIVNYNLSSLLYLSCYITTRSKLNDNE